MSPCPDFRIYPSDQSFLAEGAVAIVHLYNQNPALPPSPLNIPRALQLLGWSGHFTLLRQIATVTDGMISVLPLPQLPAVELALQSWLNNVKTAGLL